MADLDRMHTIGEVVRLLKEDFEDVSISKIRFLENQGLIRPVRTETGYRKFSGRDVDKLRAILRLQKDSFLPLRVIKDKIEKGNLLIDDRGSSGRSVKGKKGDSGIKSLQDLMTVTGLDKEQIAEIEATGILRGVVESGKILDGRQAFEIMRGVRVLQDYGIGPAHLRAYVLSLDKEMTFFNQILLPLVRSSSSENRKKGLKAAEELTDASMRIKGALMEVAMSKMIGGTEE